MIQILIKWLSNAAAIMISAYILPGVAINGFWAALWLVIVWSLINVFIKPILIILTLPINILTLGLFTLAINALIAMLAAWIAGGIMIANFWWALLFSLLVSIFSAMLATLVSKD